MLVLDPDLDEAVTLSAVDLVAVVWLDNTVSRAVSAVSAVSWEAASTLSQISTSLAVDVVAAVDLAVDDFEAVAVLAVAADDLDVDALEDVDILAVDLFVALALEVLDLTVDALVVAADLAADTDLAVDTLAVEALAADTDFATVTDFAVIADFAADLTDIESLLESDDFLLSVELSSLVADVLAAFVVLLPLLEKELLFFTVFPDFSASILDLEDFFSKLDWLVSTIACAKLLSAEFTQLSSALIVSSAEFFLMMFSFLEEERMLVLLLFELFTRFEVSVSNFLMTLEAEIEVSSTPDSTGDS